MVTVMGGEMIKKLNNLFELVICRGQEYAFIPGFLAVVHASSSAYFYYASW